MNGYTHTHTHTHTHTRTHTHTHTHTQSHTHNHTHTHTFTNTQAPFGGAAGKSRDTDARIICAQEGGLSAKSTFEGLEIVGANYGVYQIHFFFIWGQLRHVKNI
jgi:ABC-type Zn2+ transport system substrate-binding protein/surface adhesin